MAGQRTPDRPRNRGRKYGFQLRERNRDPCFRHVRLGPQINHPSGRLKVAAEAFEESAVQISHDKTIPSARISRRGIPQLTAMSGSGATGVELWRSNAKFLVTPIRWAAPCSNWRFAIHSIRGPMETQPPAGQLRRRPPTAAGRRTASSRIFPPAPASTTRTAIDGTERRSLSIISVAIASEAAAFSTDRVITRSNRPISPVNWAPEARPQAASIIEEGRVQRTEPQSASKARRCSQPRRLRNRRENSARD